MANHMCPSMECASSGHKPAMVSAPVAVFESADPLAAHLRAEVFKMEPGRERVVALLQLRGAGLLSRDELFGELPFSSKLTTDG